MDTQRLILLLIFLAFRLDAVARNGRPSTARRRSRHQRSPGRRRRRPRIFLRRRPRQAPPAQRRSVRRPPPTRRGDCRAGRSRSRRISTGSRSTRGRRDRASRAAQASRSERRSEALPRAASARRSARNIAQSGLLGEGMPNHRTLYEAVPRTPRARRGGRLAAIHARDDRAQRRQGPPDLDVPSRQLRDRRAYDITNAGTAPIAPYAYFQLVRDTKTPGHAQLDGAGVLCRAR